MLRIKPKQIDLFKVLVAINTIVTFSMAVYIFPIAAADLFGATIIGASIETDGVTTPSLDTSSAATMSIGGSNSNALNLSRSGITTNVKGKLTVDELSTFNGQVSIGDNGDTVAINSSAWDISSAGVITGVDSLTATNTVSAGNVQSAGLDASTATELSVGSQNANALSLSRSGVVTNVKGNLTIDGTSTHTGAATFSGQLTLGDGGDTGAINTSDWDISSTGDMTGIGSISSNGSLTLSGTVTASGVDSDSAELKLGNTNATSVTVGRSGVTTTASGALTVSQTLTGNGQFALGDGGDTGAINTSDWDISSTGDMTGIGSITSNGSLTLSGTVTASAVDSDAAELKVGNTNATSVTVGRSGITTTASGALTVSQALTGNGQFTLGDGGDTGAINTSDWDISSTGDISGAGALNIDGQLNFSAASELTISSGAITATETYHTVDTESDAASDDLDTINGGTEGDILVIRPVNTARTVVAKDQTGNLQLEGHFTMDDSFDTLTLLYDGSNWVELSRNGQQFIGARITNNADISISNNSATKVTFNTETFDSSNIAYQASASLTGTVSKTSGSATLTGTSTLFTSELSVGQLINVPGDAAMQAEDEVKVVTAIASNTSLTVNSNFSYTASGKIGSTLNRGIVAPIPGLYLISVGVDFDASGAANEGIRYFYPKINNSTVPSAARMNGSSSGTFVGSFSTIYRLNQWDYVELEVLQTNGSSFSINLNTEAWSPYLSIIKIAD